MDSPVKPKSARLEPLLQLGQFESGTRSLRWLFIIAVTAFFPYNAAANRYVLLLIGCGLLYNAACYSKRLLRWRPFVSPVTVLIVDNLLTVGLIALVGTAYSAFSAFLMFTVVAATFRYRLLGGVLVAIGQSIGVYVIAWHPLFQPTPLGGPASIFVLTSALLGLGLLVDRLTSINRAEHSKLMALNAQNELERSHLIALANTLKSAIFVVDDKGMIVLYNDAAVVLTGSKPSMRAQPLDEVLRLYKRKDSEARAVKLLDGSDSPQHRRDLSIRSADNQVIDLDITVQTVQLAVRAAPVKIILCEDITNERSLDEERLHFISVASHELRTPIAIMEAALSNALLNSRLAVEIRPLIEQAHDNSALLASIVKDLSALSRAQNDNLPMAIEQLDAQSMLMELAIWYRPQAEQKDLVLELSTDPATPLVLTTKQHVHEILQNYVTNAIKYSPAGKIRLTAKPAENGGVLFSVSDYGIGISAADQKRLFTKFFRAEDYRTRKTGGTGLGLYLCRELAERIGAKVWCESAVNEGATFYLQVPQFSGHSASPATPASNETHADPVLVAPSQV